MAPKKHAGLVVIARIATTKLQEFHRLEAQYDQIML
jgi:hypothetical protein